MMIFNDREILQRLEIAEGELKLIHERYWKLESAHNQLLAHLGLREIETPPIKKIVVVDSEEDKADRASRLNAGLGQAAFNSMLQHQNMKQGQAGAWYEIPPFRS